jgi:ABC-type transport system substrate-binding protein
MYAIDRQAVIDQIVRPWNPDAEVLNCGFVSLPGMSEWCRARPFEQFIYDPARARSILESDGYDCSTPLCTRSGKVLVIPYSVVSTATRRTTTQQLLTERAKAAGLLFRARNYEYTGYFNVARISTMADYATGGEVDPSVTEMFACDEIPTKESDFYGGNSTHWCNPAADLLMHQADRELDPERRLELMELVYELEALDFVSLPLYVLPAASIWRSDQIAGPIGLWNSSPYGLFYNMNEWYLP